MIKNLTKESFDNYYEEINSELYNLFPKDFENYLRTEWSDKVKFHKKISNLSNYPLTVISTIQNLQISFLEKLGKKGCYWYIKKKNGSYGRNITITKNPITFFGSLIRTSDINNYVIQKEILSDNYKGKKYDYRVYLLIIKINGKINYYYYDDYIVRFCYEKEDEAKPRNVYNSITNHHIYSLQKLDRNFYCFNKDFEKNHQEKIVNLNESFITLFSLHEKDFINLLKDNEFRILGMDYLVEKNSNKLFILEMNTVPGVFYSNSEEDFFIKYNNFHKVLICDLNNLIFNNKSEKWIKIS